MTRATLHPFAGLQSDGTGADVSSMKPRNRLEEWYAETAAQVVAWFAPLDGVEVGAHRTRAGRIEFVVGQHEGAITLTRNAARGDLCRVDVSAVAVEDQPWIRSWFERYACQLCADAALVEHGDDKVVFTATSRVDHEAFSQDSVAAAIGECRYAVEAFAFVVAHPPQVDRWGQFLLGYDDLAVTLARAGIALPPVPLSMQACLAKVHPWVWATYDLDPLRLYLGEEPVEEASPEDRFACGHVGHGTNSYFWVVDVVWAGRHLSGHYPLGGIYERDRVAPRETIARAMLDLHHEVELLNGYDPDECVLEAIVARLAARRARQQEDDG